MLLLLDKLTGMTPSNMLGNIMLDTRLLKSVLNGFNGFLISKCLARSLACNSQITNSLSEVLEMHSFWPIN